MRTHRSITLAAAGLLAVGLGVSPALAQQGHGHMDEKDGPPHAGMMEMKGSAAHSGMPSMMGGDHGRAMMAAMAFGPGPMMLLHQKEALGLTEEQASRLDSLRAAMHGTMEEHRAGMEEVHGQMQELASSGEPSMDRFRELLERMADARVELAVEMARVHREAMAVLTEEQRSNARYGMKLMHRMMRHHRGDGPHGGMGEGMHGQGGGR